MRKSLTEVPLYAKTDFREIDVRTARRKKGLFAWAFKDSSKSNIQD